MKPEDTAPLRLAMWSGPRNISTAMMRAFENRPDCAVIDEPLYAHYLAHTGSDHPGAAEVIAQGDTDWQRVVAGLLGPVPGSRPFWYQKHMSHHLLPHIGHDWIHRLVNVFLIRDPDEVVASYIRSRAEVCAADIGLEQQAQLFDEVAQRQGTAPPVIDAGDFLRAPAAHLRALCHGLGIAFDECMLSWPAGPRDSDGVWAPHWYAAVWRSTGFEPWQPRQQVLGGAARQAAQEARPWYEHLYRHRLVVEGSG